MLSMGTAVNILRSLDNKIIAMSMCCKFKTTGELTGEVSWNNPNPRISRGFMPRLAVIRGGTSTEALSQLQGCGIRRPIVLRPHRARRSDS